MKVLVVSNLYPPNAVGGYEQLTALVASSLTRLGHRVSVLTSDYGALRPEREELLVERSLKLLAGRDNIYRPFAGSAAEREAVNRHNLACLARRLESERPDAILVGNLHFLDPSILEGLRLVASKTVFLLTDIWMVHFADDAFLQDYFRRSVFNLVQGTPPLVHADPPGLLLDRVESSEAWSTYAAAMAPEVARRRQWEEELAAGRAVFQVRGICYLCGPTSFVVRRAGPATLMLPVRRDAGTTCARCGLDGTTRGALHALDVIAGPEGTEEILLVVGAPGARQLLQERYLRSTVVASVAELGGNRKTSAASYRHVVCLESMTGVKDAGHKLRQVAGRLDAGGALVFGGALLPGDDGSPGVGTPGVPSDDELKDSAGRGPIRENGGDWAPAWPILEQVRDAGLADAAAYLFWSKEYGYLGRDHVLYAGRVGVRG